MITPAAVRKNIAKGFQTVGALRLTAVITHKTQGAFDPTTGTNAITTTSQTLKVLSDQIEREFVDNRVVQMTNIYVRSAELTIAVSPEDTVVYNSMTWRVSGDIENNPLSLITRIPMMNP